MTRTSTQVLNNVVLSCFNFSIFCSNDKKTWCQKFKNCIKVLFFLQPLTLYKILTTADYLSLFQIFEVLFEAFPQFVLQTYTILLFGFGFYESGYTFRLSSNIVLSPPR